MYSPDRPLTLALLREANAEEIDACCSAVATLRALARLALDTEARLEALFCETEDADRDEATEDL